jgi:dihydrodipicolinate synthase/N-acetylneuraminate lyase
VGDAVPELPLLPYFLGPSIDVVALMRDLLAIPNMAGTKYTGPNMFELGQIIELGKEAREGTWTTFSGMDEQAAFAAMLGTDGNIGSTLNFMPGVYVVIHAAIREGDLARARDLQSRANRITQVAISFGYLGAMREIVGLLGYPCGAPRLPALPMAEERCKDLRDALDAAGFWELPSVDVADR